VLSRSQGGFGAAAVTLVTAGLIVAEIDDLGFRRWWAAHPLTTDTVGGLLVLLITVLVVDQVVTVRQLKDRSRATAAQGAILMAQARRAANALSGLLAGTGNRDATSEEMRTYAVMLMVGAPVLMEGKVSRDFLEEAQNLAGEMARLLGAMAKHPGSPKPSSERMDNAVARLRAASVPVLQPLDLDELLAAGAESGTTS
jgi:hypothetical protein